MPRGRLLIFGGLFLVGLAIAWIANQRLQEPPLPPVKAVEIQTAPLCPWRSPEADLSFFFPGATGHKEEMRILSGVRPQLRKELGRLPTAEENALRVHRITSGDTLLGYIIAARAKGEHGAIELVMALNPEGKVRGTRCQRIREPETIATALQDKRWWGAFEGKGADDKFQPGEDLPDVPVEAKESALNIADCVRSVLILFRTSEGLQTPKVQTQAQVLLVTASHGHA
jgi:hypothetical protein